jgi:DNA mismatch endonuclease (patch repair protein)
MDVVSTERRSALMSRVRSRDTGPELAVRRAARRLGYRYRLHRRDLPGTPDLIFPRLRKALFVHGCFWHRHEGCRLAYEPKSNGEFWRRKFAGNVARDARKTDELRDRGWDVLTVWECEVHKTAELPETLRKRLAYVPT